MSSENALIGFPGLLFRLILLICLITEPLQLSPALETHSTNAKLSQSGGTANPLEPGASAMDIDDCPDALLSTLPEIVRIGMLGRPLQQSSARLYSFAAGVPFDHLSRPPPAV
jgi:hypothetical protein